MDLIAVITQNIASFIFILSVIVFIHEYGHYWVAKKGGVKIESFSIGFGKELFGWNDKNGVRWKISLVPLGGYVKMFGDEGAASTPDNEAMEQMSKEELNSAFHKKPLLTRFLVVLAGPMANFIFAIIILTGFFSYYGRPETLPVVYQVQENSAAAEIGLQEGDRIIEMDGKSIERFADLKSVATMHPDIEVSLTYTRDGQEIKTTITPKRSVSTDVFGQDLEVGLIGVSSSEVIYNDELGLVGGFTTAVTETYSISVKTLEAVGQMIIGQRPADQISGILRIADYSGKSVDKGFKMVLWFMAILSINLGLVNLFPIPMLDGGHLFFYIIEALRGKPLSDKTQEYCFRFGFAMLIGLMVFATFNDLKYFNIF
jgi:regulator of sigma E protease